MRDEQDPNEIKQTSKQTHKQTKYPYPNKISSSTRQDALCCGSIRTCLASSALLILIQNSTLGLADCASRCLCVWDCVPLHMFPWAHRDFVTLSMTCAQCTAHIFMKCYNLLIALYNYGDKHVFIMMHFLMMYWVKYHSTS